MKYFLIVFYISFLTSPLIAQRWPLNPQNSQYPIVGTIGEDRGSGNRFHKGCDIAESAGTLVVSIEDGIVSSKGNSSLCVGTYCYIHVVPLPSLVLGDTISSGDTIGVIQFISNQHIHLQKTDSLYNRIPNVNVDTILWANALNFLSPFVDNSLPDVQGLHVFEYQSYGNNVGGDFYGNLDIVMNVTDPRITASGGNGNANINQGVAPYSMSYILLDPTQMDTFFRHENTFEFSPNNANTNLIFTSNTSVATSDYEYYLNSYFRTPPIRRPFNVRKSTGISLAETPDSVLIEDGNRMLLKVIACDIVGNCDEEIYQQGGSNYMFTLDNFKPYLKSIEASINGTVVYDFTWKTVDGELSPSGGIPANIPGLTAFDLAQGMIIEIEASEQLNDLQLDLHRTVTNCSDNVMISSTAGVMEPNRRVWRFTSGELLSCPLGGGMIDPTGGPWKFIFRGHDFGPSGNPGSELLGFHRLYDAVTDGNGNSSISVPLAHRINTAAPEWSNTGHPDLTEGVDSTHYFRFDCSGNLWDPGDDENIAHNQKSVNQALRFVCCDDIEVSVSALRTFSPSDCGSSDGSISLRGRNASPSLPSGEEYTFHWEKNGVEIEANRFGGVDNASVGRYCLVATAPDGCFGSHCVDLGYDLFPDYFFEDIQSACGNTASGKIELLVVDDSDGSGLFHFRWSTGQVDQSTDISIVRNLFAGTYAVTLTNVELPECEIVKTYVVDSEDIESDPIILNAALTHPCPNTENGEIKIEVEGGRGPFDILWSDGQDYDFTRESLVPGNWSVTVTGRCRSISKNITLSPLEVETTVESGCGGGVVQAIARFGNPPYRFIWSDGVIQNSSGVSSRGGLRSGSYGVTVIDQNGCQEVVEGMVLDNQEIIIENVESSCRGLETGGFNIIVNNPGQVFPSIFLNGNSIGGSTQTGNDFMLPVTGLGGGETYEIRVDFNNGCVVELNQDIELDNLEREFLGVEDDICRFRQTCGGEIIGDGEPTIFSEVTYSLQDSEGNATTPFGKCKIGGRCEGVDGVVTTKKTGIVTMTIAEYRALIRSLTGVLFTADQVTNQSFGNSFNFFNNIPTTGFDCNKVWVCPLSLRATPRPGATFGLFGDSGHLFEKPGTRIPADENGCPRMICPTNNDPVLTLCGDGDIISNFNIDPRSLEPTIVIPDNCEMITKSVFKLMTWHEQILDDEVEGELYEFTSLYDFIIDLIDLPDGDARKKRAICASVTFCRNDYSFVESDIDLINCSGFQAQGQVGGVICQDPSIPGLPQVTCSWIQGCLAEPLENTNLIRIQCATPNDFFVEDFDPVFDPAELNSLHPGGDDEVVAVSLLDNQTEHMQHARISYIEDQGILYPKPVASTRSGKQLYLDFDPYAKMNSISYNFDQIKYNHVGYENYDLYYLLKRGDNHFSFIIEKEGQITKDVSITAEGQLDVSVEYDQGAFNLSLLAKGKLNVANHLINESNGKTVVSQVQITKEGTVLPMKGVIFPTQQNAEVSKYVDLHKNPSLIKLEDNVRLSTLGGSTQENSGVNKVHSFDFSSGRRTSYSVPNLKDIVITSSYTSGRKIKFLSKPRNSLEENIVYVNDYSEESQFIQPVTSPSGRILDQSITQIDNELSVVAITFEEEIRYSEYQFYSKGGKDILLLLINSQNNLLGFQQYFSEDDEEITQVDYKNGYLILGGSYSGKTHKRQIGNYYFEQPVVTMENGHVMQPLERPFLSVTELKAFKKVGKREQESEVVSKETELRTSIFLYPNPSTENVFVEIKSNNVTAPIILDVTGKAMDVDVSMINRKEKTIYNFTTNELKDGLYIFNVLIDGQSRSVKFVVNHRL